MVSQAPGGPSGAQQSPRSHRVDLVADTEQAPAPRPSLITAFFGKRVPGDAEQQAAEKAVEQRDNERRAAWKLEEALKTVARADADKAKLAAQKQEQRAKKKERELAARQLAAHADADADPHAAEFVADKTSPAAAPTQRGEPAIPKKRGRPAGSKSASSLAPPPKKPLPAEQVHKVRLPSVPDNGCSLAQAAQLSRPSGIL
jgi:hypothetical protein